MESAIVISRCENVHALKLNSNYFFCIMRHTKPNYIRLVASQTKLAAWLSYGLRETNAYDPAISRSLCELHANSAQNVCSTCAVKTL